MALKLLGEQDQNTGNDFGHSADFSAWEDELGRHKSDEPSPTKDQSNPLVSSGKPSDSLRKAENSISAPLKDIDRNNIAKAENSSSWKTNITTNTGPKYEKGSKNSSKGSFFSRHKKGVTGWIIGLALGGGMLGIGGIVSGPAQFIQAMNLLQEAKLFVTGAQTGARMLANMATTFRWGLADNIAEGIQNSRLGIIGTKMAKSTVKKLEKSGVSFDRNLVGNARSITIDTTKEFGGNLFNEDASGKKWTPEQRAKRQELLAKRFGVDPKALKSLDSKGIATIDFDKMSYRESRRFINNVKGVSRFNIYSRIQTRLMLKRVGKISALHPIKNLKKKLANKFSDWVTKRIEQMAAKGFSSAAEAAKAAADKAEEAARKDAEVKGKTITEDAIKSIREAAEKTAKEGFEKAMKEAAERPIKGVTKDVIAKAGAKATSASVKSAIPIVGWILLAIQVYCMLDALDDGIGAEKYANVVVPAIGDTGEMLGLGSQPESGEDLNAQELGFNSQLRLYNDDITEVAATADPSTGEQNGSEVVGKTSSSWWDAAPIKAELGEDYGDASRSAVPAPLDDVISGSLSFGGNKTIGKVWNTIMDIIDSGMSGHFGVLSDLGLWPHALTPMAMACWALDKLDNLIGWIVGGLLSLPPLSNLMDWFSSTPLAKAAINIMSTVKGWLRGNPLDLTAAVPETYGSVNMYGALFSANEQMLANGGRALSSQETAELMTEQKQLLAEQRAQKPLLSRIFDPYDYSSSVSTIARAANFAPANDFASIFGNALKLFASTPKIFGLAVNKIGGGNVSAFDPTPYDYHTPTIAFSLDEMETITSNNESFEIENNTQAVFDMVDNGTLPSGKIEKCFGVSIGGAPEYAVEQLDNSEGKAWDYVENYTNAGNMADCNGEEMLHIRTYIMDYNLVMSSACYEGDNNDPDIQSACKEMGFEESSSSSSNETISGDAQELARKILDNSNITLADGIFSPSDEKDRSTPLRQIQDIAAGKTVGRTTRQCPKGFTPSIEGAVPNPDSKLLGFIAELGESHKFQINALFGQCHGSPGGAHYQGKAVDFQCQSGGFDSSANKSFGADADTIGAKYGVTINPGYVERCDSLSGSTILNDHYHYSVGGG